MPKQNRVTPLGEIVAVPDRGTLMGNRGVLHGDTGTIRRAWQLRRWILCVLEFKGRKRKVMSPGCYTELFFLDEATGLAAGHRPCAECQRQRFRQFRDAWSAGNPGCAGRRPPTAGEIDDRLHAERIGEDGEKLRFDAELDGLPDGVFVTLEGDGETAWLLWQGELLAWSPGGYRVRRPRPAGERVSVLTPASTVAAIRAGFVPGVHDSAGVS
jgi:hypothetical protein